MKSIFIGDWIIQMCELLQVLTEATIGMCFGK